LEPFLSFKSDQLWQGSLLLMTGDRCLTRLALSAFGILAIMLLSPSGIGQAQEKTQPTEAKAASPGTQNNAPEPKGPVPKGGGEKEGGSRRGNKPRDPVAVKTMKVLLTERSRTVKIIGLLQGIKQVIVYSRVAGRVTFIGAKEGERVNAGAILMRVDRSDPGESFVPTPVTSPIDGWVGRWLVNSTGSQVNTQDPAVIIVDDTVLRTKVALPIDDWLKVTSQTPVQAEYQQDHIPQSNGESKGSSPKVASIAAIARTGDSLSSRGTVTVDIANSNHDWKAGMLVTIAFELDKKPRLIIPASALSLTDQGNFVFQLREGKAHRRAVKFRAFDHDFVEIEKGLEPGTEILTEGVHLVADGTQVKVVTESKETAS
jgi:multidrug efflux pump subunit AcrA (membrane-fusion protein)